MPKTQPVVRPDFERSDAPRAVYARQAIETRYAGPTNARGSRIIVRADAGRMTIPWDHALDVAANHAAAIAAFARKMGWSGPWHLGATKDGYVGVNAAEGTEIP